MTCSWKIGDRVEKDDGIWEILTITRNLNKFRKVNQTTKTLGFTYGLRKIHMPKSQVLFTENFTD